MGAMKRLLGWKQSNWPIPQPLQAFAGLVPWRPTAEDLADRKRAAAEAKAEREAIQAEARDAEAPRPKPQPRPEIAAAVEFAAPYGADLPKLAAPDWYRFGATFYRLESGPFPRFDRTEAMRPEPVRLVQRSLFG